MPAPLDLLATIYRYISRDEAAHGGFYLDVIGASLAEDRDATIADLWHVFSNFTMPAYDLVPGYDERVRHALDRHRQEGVPQGVFLPVLARLGCHDLN